MTTEQIEVNAIDGKCIRCGKCCGLFIPVTKKEVNIIKKYVAEKNIQPENRYDGNKLELRCPFLDLKKNVCKIYPVRPYVCRDFICSRKDWKKHREKYHLRADYNGLANGRISKKGMYSLDELIYNDFFIHLRFLLEEVKSENNKVELDRFKEALKLVNRLDLLEKIKIECEEN